MTVLCFLSELVYVVSTSDFVLSSSILESANTLLLSRVDLCLLLVVIITELVGVLGRFNHVVLEALIVQAVSVAWTFQLSDTGKNVEFVILPPSIEATTAERGCNLETALTRDHLRTLGAVLVVCT